MKFQIISYSLPLLLLSGITHAYVLASDCTGDIRVKIREAVDAAFSRIELAATELEKITTNNGANDDIKGTAGYLFEDGDLAGILAKMQGSLTARYNLDLDDPDFQNRWTPGSDILIYCTEGSRYGIAGSNKVFANKEFNIEASKDFYDGCFKSKGTHAFALVAEHDPSVPSLIQLCPWFYDKFITAQPNGANNKKKPAFINALNKFADKIAFSHKTPADLTADLVHTIAHEISHTRPGGMTDDSGKKDIVSVIGQFLFNLDGYGWFNCVRLKSNHNADSHAFFSTMANVIINTGQRPTEDGGMDPIPGWSAPAVVRRLLRSIRSLSARLDFRSKIAAQRLDVSS